MGVEYYTCTVCGVNFPDCGEYYTCIHCEELICGYCYSDQKKKYGVIDEDSEDLDYFGEDALLKCDSCVNEDKKDDQKLEIIEILEEVIKISWCNEQWMVNQFFDKYEYPITKLIKDLKNG